jgi:hypothetical protein
MIAWNDFQKPSTVASNALIAPARSRKRSHTPVRERTMSSREIMRRQKTG